MNSREKFNAVMGFEANTPNLRVEYGYWAGIIKSWNKEGIDVFKGIKTELKDTDLVRMSLPLSPDIKENNLDTVLTKYFGLESYPVKFPCDMSSQMPKKVLEITDWGAVNKRLVFI